MCNYSMDEGATFLLSSIDSPSWRISSLSKRNQFSILPLLVSSFTGGKKSLGAFAYLHFRRFVRDLPDATMVIVVIVEEL